MSGQIFNVLTEFKFEIGSALLNTQALQNQVDGLSRVADNAVGSFQRLGVGIVANLGLANTGVIGLFGEAISSSEKFRDAQRSFANIISANKEHFTGAVDTFQERLNASEETIKSIVAIGRKFAIPTSDLLSLTKIVSAQLSPLGLSGKNFDVATDISRSLLKAAPLLGVDPGQIQGELANLIGGSAHQQNTLFRRLTNETQAFAPFGGQKGSGAFNALPIADRVDVLRKGLGQFSKDMEVLGDRFNSITGQMQLLKDTLIGVGSILKPLGDALRVPIAQILTKLNQVLLTDGKQIVENISSLISGIVENPRRFLVDLLQLRALSGDFAKSKKIFELSTLFFALGSALKFLGFEGGIVSLALSPLRTILGFIASNFFKIIPLFVTIAGFILPLLGSALAATVPPFLAFLALTQLISRAQAIAHLNDAAALPGFLKDLSDVFLRMKNSLSLIIGPFSAAFDFFARLLAPIFQVTITGRILIDILNTIAAFFDKLSTVVVGTMATISGAFEALFAFIESGKNIFKGGFGEGVAEAFTREFNRFVSGAGDETKGNAVAQSVVNIGTQNVNIRNDFKENQEPDRIAFTIKDQLMKAAQNPTQGRGQGIALGLVRSGARS